MLTEDEKFIVTDILDAVEKCLVEDKPGYWIEDDKMFYITLTDEQKQAFLSARRKLKEV